MFLIGGGWQNLCAMYLVTQLCPTLGDPMDCSPPGFSVHGDSPGKDAVSPWLLVAPCKGVFSGMMRNQGKGSCHCTEPSGVPRDPSQLHSIPDFSESPLDLPEITGTSRGNQGFPAPTRKRPRESFFNASGENPHGRRSSRKPLRRPRPRELRAFFSCMAWRAIPGPLSTTLWVKAQHEGALPPPCIVRKDPRVPHTARRGA